MKDHINNRLVYSDDVYQSLREWKPPYTKKEIKFVLETVGDAYPKEFAKGIEALNFVRWLKDEASSESYWQQSSEDFRHKVLAKLLRINL